MCTCGGVVVCMLNVCVHVVKERGGGGRRREREIH